MARRDLFKNSTDHASGELDYVLKRTAKKAGGEEVPTVTPEQAMREERIVQHKSDRNVTRVLFISQNIELLNPTRQTLDGYLEISDIFDEVHILVLRQGIKAARPVLRPQKNVWIYTAATKYWWQMPSRGRELLKEQLVFAEGFRADLVVARDPFESALVALWVQKTYKKTTQLHVLQNLYGANFNKQASWNWLRKLIARYTIPNFQSVRTSTKNIKNLIQEKFKPIDIKPLPQLNPYESIAQMRQTLDLKKKYPHHVFNMLFVGKSHATSTASRVIDAARFMLINPRVGMIMLIDDELYDTCHKRAKLLGVDKQMVFEKRAVDIPQYLKASDLLIVSDTDADSEELVLKGAGAGIPMIMVETEKRADLFTHLETAYIIPPDDVQALADAIHFMMNNFSIRNSMVEQAQKVIIKEFHQDKDEYQRDYRDSIEQAFFVEELKLEESKKS